MAWRVYVTLIFQTDYKLKIRQSILITSIWIRRKVIVKIFWRPWSDFKCCKVIQIFWLVSSLIFLFLRQSDLHVFRNLNLLTTDTDFATRNNLKEYANITKSKSRSLIVHCKIIAYFRTLKRIGINPTNKEVFIVKELFEMLKFLSLSYSFYYLF